MKYLIQNRRELIITIGVFATVVIIVVWTIWAIINGELSYKNMIGLLTALFEILGWYFNMTTSPENFEHTNQMRLEKRKTDLPENYWGDVDNGEPEDPFDECEEGGKVDG